MGGSSATIGGTPSRPLRWFNPAMLTPHADDLWSIPARQGFFGWQLGTRMTVVRLDDVSTLADVWEYVDYDGVFEHGVVEPGGDRFTWVRWYVGDTEVGYIYFEGTLQLAAIVGDGDIHHCTVAR